MFATVLNRTIQTLFFVLVIVPILIRSQLSTSLYVPGFDPQPLSADVIGVGSDRRTTWVLHKGKPDATDTSSYVGFIGTATLVQGPNDVFLTYANSLAHLTLGEECTFSGSTMTVAICIVVAQGSTATQTEAVSYLPIQGGGVGLPSSGSTTPSAPPGFTTGSSTMVKSTADASSGTHMVSDSSGAVPPTQSGVLPSTSSSSLPSSSNFKADAPHWPITFFVISVSLLFLFFS